MKKVSLKHKIAMLMLCFMAIIASALTPDKVMAAEQMVLETSSVEGKAGDTVSVTVSLKENPGLAGIAFKLNYDEAVLTVSKTTVGTTLSNPEIIADNGEFIGYAYAAATDSAETGNLITIDFKIKDGVAATESTLDLVVESTSDADEQEVLFNAIDGKVTVKAISTEKDDTIPNKGETGYVTVILMMIATLAIVVAVLAKKESVKKTGCFVLILSVLVTGLPISMIAAEPNAITGTLGDNNGIQWSYNETTKTLTITGEDTGVVEDGSVESPFYDICDSVETINFENCKIVGSAHGLFAYLQDVTSVDMTGLDASEITDMSSMFYLCKGLTDLDISGINTSQVTDMSKLFFACMGLPQLDISDLDTSNVTDMNNMFAACYELTSLDISNLDTSKVTDMSGMFDCCTKLTGLDTSSLDTSQVTDMSAMFANCKALASLDVSDFDTSKVTEMNNMFASCEKLTSLDVSNFDTSNVTDMSVMFNGCSNLTSLDISNFDISKGTYYLDSGDDDYGFGYMLGRCDKLEIIATPKNMTGLHRIVLPATFYDAEYNSVKIVHSETCNMILTRNIGLEVGEVADLSYKSTSDSDTWESSNTAVATVDNNGKITAVGAGTATITLTFSDDSSETIGIVVTEDETDVESDLNGDGELDETDVTVLKKYFAGSENSGLDLETADLNGDGKVTIADAVRLCKYLAGDNVTLG